MDFVLLILYFLTLFNKKGQEGDNGVPGLHTVHAGGGGGLRTLKCYGNYSFSVHTVWQQFLSVNLAFAKTLAPQYLTK